MADKLFIVVRSDLPPGAQACQAVHAAVLFGHLRPDVEVAWWEASKNLALLAVPDEAALHELARLAAAAGVPYAANTEPDLGDSLTSVALGPTSKRLVRDLPLLLRADPETAKDCPAGTDLDPGLPPMAWAV